MPYYIRGCTVYEDDNGLCLYLQTSEKSKYDQVFDSLQPVNGMLAGDKVRPVSTLYLTGFPQALQIMVNQENHYKSSMYFEKT